MALVWKRLSLKAGFGSSDTKDGGEIETPQNFNDVEPELFIKFVRIPSLKTYASLRSKLDICTKEWLTEFLELGGLTSLFEVLRKLSERGLGKFSDAFLQLECVRCIKSVMNNVTGLQFMASDSSLTRHLATGKHGKSFCVCVCRFAKSGYLS